VLRQERLASQTRGRMSRNVVSLSSQREFYPYPEPVILKEKKKTPLPAHKSAILQSVVIACFGTDFDSGGSAYGRRINADSSICYCRTSIFMSSCGSEGVDCNSGTEFDTVFSAVLELICLNYTVCQNNNALLFLHRKDTHECCSMAFLLILKIVHSYTRASNIF